MLKFFRKQSHEVEVTVSNRTIVRILIIVIGAFMLLSAVRIAQHAIILISTSIFLALALNAPVHWLAIHWPGKRKGNRTVATAVSFLLVIAALAAFIASIVPPLVHQTSEFIDAAPGLVESVRSEDSSLGRFIRRYNLEDEVDKFSGELSAKAQEGAGKAFGTVTRVGSSIFSVLTVLVLTFMMLIEGPRWLRFAKRLIPAEHEMHANDLTIKMYRVIKGFVNGQVLLAMLAALVIVVPLIVLHVGNPIALMVVVFICGLIPLVGHTIGAIIVSTVALFESPVTALIVLAYYILYQQIENYVIQPRIQANSTDMSPLFVFSAVIIGVSFNGLLGGLVAIPVAGCLRILVLDYLEHSKLLSRKEVEEITSTNDYKDTDDTKKGEPKAKPA